ncbi:MAG: HAD-IB family phosphatase [Deltaproteobacteria bacterium]|nr:HAD-IB family phosphatase [Deltaproteobacteria bacterium]MBW2017657.1 HAD-IB family phosphatase [Deltaproteobacteria bacterium]MBW2130530.1 HAD-IB family phosphatase [Deltaproteobacteria bacterium]MBW2303595.1 HAD-IB family phosphatase [Deltaproteobacteria bacterium]
MGETNKILSLSAVGLDSPGLVSKITRTIYELAGNIIDVEENCRRGLFSIFLVIDFSSSEKSMDDIEKALGDLEKETGLKVTFGVFESDEIYYPGEREHHIVTLLGTDKPGIIMQVSTFFHKWNINIENCKMIARGEFFSMEMVIDTSHIRVEEGRSREEALDRMKAELKELCGLLGQSVVIQSEDIYRKAKKLVVFDVESTLIRHDSLTQFFEKIAGKVKAANGESIHGEEGENGLERPEDYARHLKGIPIKDLESFGEVLQLNPGSLELIRILKSMGFKIALISSGFSFFIKRIFEEAGVDYAFSNMLEVDREGIITGKLEEPAITPASKEEILEFIMGMEKVGPDQVIGVGDGSTQSHFIRNTGLSIAFKPENTTIATDGILGGDKILSMLYCLGIPKQEIEKHLKNAPPLSPQQS